MLWGLNRAERLPCFSAGTVTGLLVACCLLLIKTGWHHHKFTALCVVPHLVEANKFPKTCQRLHIVQTTTSHNFESLIQIHFSNLGKYILQVGQIQTTTRHNFESQRLHFMGTFCTKLPFEYHNLSDVKVNCYDIGMTEIDR